MQDIQEYNPLKWPPDVQLAKVHMRCVCPGKDNVDGIQCPCCGRFEKIKTKRWFSRDILKDFKNYGGGVPGYFELLKYCWVTLAILAIIVILFHIYVLESICPLIHLEYKDNEQDLLLYGCQSFLFVFKLCDAKIIFNTLNKHGKYAIAFVFFYLQLFSFIYLIVVTIGMKLWLQKINSTKIVKEEKVYSYFSLMLKNIPKFYQIENIRLELEELLPGVDICEIFFVYEIAELETIYKQLFDLHFEIEHVKDSIAAQRGDTIQKLNSLIQKYSQLYQKSQQLKKKIGVNNGRAIVVFNSSNDRDTLYKKLKIGQCSKFYFHSMKMLGHNTLNLHFFADKLPEPQQIIWKYIGESSMTKTVVRIKTTVIGFGFLIIAFLLLYFPIIKIDEENISNHSIVTSLLSIFVSILLQILSIVYRQIILKILPSRHPSSRESESYFVVITTVVFHFFFYIIAPGTYFILAKAIPINIKLKQLFVAVLTFLAMTVLVAFIDLRYRLYNGRRKKIMSSWNEWGKYCQMRLHQQIRWPSFPIQFKLMVILNIWSFNAFYIFQIPYLLFLFVVVITVLFWVDKKNIYNHYKMQVFQSIDLELSVQRDYIVMFLVCVCCGYAICAIDTWQYFFIGAMFVVSILVNWFLSFRNKKMEKKKVEKSMTLGEVVRAQSKNPKQSILQSLKTNQLKQNLMFMQNASTVSLGSVTFTYGYKQIYDTYLNQFKSKHIHHLLESTFKQYVHPEYSPQREVEEIRRTTYLPKLNLKKVTEMSQVSQMSQIGELRKLGKLQADKQKEKEKERQRQREIQREKQRQRQRQKERETERDRKEQKENQEENQAEFQKIPQKQNARSEENSKSDEADDSKQLHPK